MSLRGYSPLRTIQGELSHAFREAVFRVAVGFRLSLEPIQTLGNKGRSTGQQLGEIVVESPSFR